MQPSPECRFVASSRIACFAHSFPTSSPEKNLTIRCGGPTGRLFSRRAREPAKLNTNVIESLSLATAPREPPSSGLWRIRAKPDFVFIPGDIVYTRGLISEYRTKYFPVYNAANASPQTGAPLIRSTLFIAAPGNHDVLNANLTQNPDALAYFLYWSQPLNGPLTRIDDPSAPHFQATNEEKKAFLATASATYPRMANFSFDYGNAHWTVLDADPYVDWTDPALRDWIAKDLAVAKSATWRFVGFHHPGLLAPSELPLFASHHQFYT